MSFTAGTKVLLANGRAVPIAHLQPGAKVLATNTRTVKTSAEPVSAVLVHHDTNRYNLNIRTAHGTAVIHTTTTHLFWSLYLNQWVAAAKLKKGEVLKTADGTIATADGGITPKVHDGWMWDLTVPGNYDHDFYVLPAQTSSHHTYHVVAGDTPVLVHNCGKNQGVYIFDDLADPGKVYVGKTNNFARRLGVHVDNGRINDSSDAICIHICGTDDDLFRAEYIFKSGLEKMNVPLSNDIESPGKAIYYARQWIQRGLF